MQKNQFNSFMWAGYECTSAKTTNLSRLNLLAQSKHDSYCKQDYELAQEVGIKTVREGFSWYHIDKGNNIYDFSPYESIIKIGKGQHIQQIWDLTHFSFPEYLDPFSEQFVFQYAEYAKRVLGFIRKNNSETLYIVPMNEPSFFSWIGAEEGLWAPYTKGRGFEFKKQLIKASIHAMNALLAEDTNIQFIHIDPLTFRKPKDSTDAHAIKYCDDFNNRIRLQSWDMLSGRLCPELGGNDIYMNFIGTNYYIYSQEWVSYVDGGFLTETIPFDNPDRTAFASLLNELYKTYQKPIIVTETGSVDTERENWWKYMFSEVEKALALNIPIKGICAYPTIDVIDTSGFIAPASGLWDFIKGDEKCMRVPHTQTLDIIKKYNLSCS